MQSVRAIVLVYSVLVRQVWARQGVGAVLGLGLACILSVTLRFLAPRGRERGRDRRFWLRCPAARVVKCEFGFLAVISSNVRMRGVSSLFRRNRGDSRSCLTEQGRSIGSVRRLIGSVRRVRRVRRLQRLFLRAPFVILRLFVSRSRAGQLFPPTPRFVGWSWSCIFSVRRASRRVQPSVVMAPWLQKGTRREKREER
eukprot:COSAG03_NODE_9186_length_740_cov_0.546022_1_plen_197_part_10